MGNSCIKKNLISPNKNKSDNTNIIFFKPENILIDWESEYKTQKYHWWPMRENKQDDNINNLYAISGGLGKYDELFNTNSIRYQKNNYFRAKDSLRKDAYWSGFCNNASILSCLYKYPKNSVCVYYNKKEITFTSRDIEALMIVCSENAIQKNISLFFGSRFNDNCDNKNEPYPTEFLKMLDIICKQDEPFVMDIDNTEAVWNYAYDKVIVSKHKTCDLINLEIDVGNVEYYNFKISSNAYENHNLDIWGYINKIEIDKNKKQYKILEEGWIDNNQPDFIWKKFKKEGVWEGKSYINPCIDSSMVYKIYQHSFNEENIRLML